MSLTFSPVEPDRPSLMSISLDQAVDLLTYPKRGVSIRAALNTVIANREEAVPRLLEELALAPVDVEARRKAAPEGRSYFLHSLATYLMGAFAEPRGWPLLLDFFMSDNDLALRSVDHYLIERLPGILVRCYDGSDLGMLRRMIETPSFDGRFRVACLNTYFGLALVGRLPRVEVTGYIRALLEAPHTGTCLYWARGLAKTAATTRDATLQPSIATYLQRAEKTVLIESWQSLPSASDIDEIYADSDEDTLSSLLDNELFDDFLDMVGGSSWFNAPRTPFSWRDDRAVQQYHAWRNKEPIERDIPKIGRNEPCRCGSGKKYKKCCMGDD